MPDPTIIEVRGAGKGQQRVIVLNDGREFIFSVEAVVEASAKPGDPAGEALFAALERAERRLNAHAIALRLLSIRSRSQAEMRQRLAARGVGPDDIEAEIERLSRAGLIDDEAFARAWVENRRVVAPRGRRLLRYELGVKGIRGDTAAAAIDDIDDAESALGLARSRAHGAVLADFDTFLARVGGLLRRRGFDYETARSAATTAWTEAIGGQADSSTGDF